MAYAGQTIANPVSGERITFMQTARDTGGELLEFELKLTPDGHVPGAHVHPEQEERFHVLVGTMRFPAGDASHRRHRGRDRRRAGRPHAKFVNGAVREPLPPRGPRPLPTCLDGPRPGPSRALRDGVIHTSARWR